MFTVRYALSPYITQIRYVFRRLSGDAMCCHVTLVLGGNKNCRQKEELGLCLLNRPQS